MYLLLQNINKIKHICPNPKFVMTRLMPAILASVKQPILLNVIFGGLLYPPKLKTMFGLVMFAAVLKLPGTKALAFFNRYPLVAVLLPQSLWILSRTFPLLIILLAFSSL